MGHFLEHFYIYSDSAVKVCTKRLKNGSPKMNRGPWDQKSPHDIDTDRHSATWWTCAPEPLIASVFMLRLWPVVGEHLTASKRSCIHSDLCPAIQRNQLWNYDIWSTNLRKDSKQRWWAAVRQVQFDSSAFLMKNALVGRRSSTGRPVGHRLASQLSYVHGIAIKDSPVLNANHLMRMVSCEW